jgi:acyl-CoA thioester hydrolase
VHEESDAGGGGDYRSIGAWRDGWFVVPVQVTFRDLDYFGHVNNAVYFSYFEWARTILWLRMFGKRDPRDIGFIVARAECVFRKQIEMEPIEVRVRIAEMRNTSLDFVYEIHKNDGRELAATGTVVVVLFDWNTNAKKPITDEFRRRVEECTHAS